MFLGLSKSVTWKDLKRLMYHMTYHVRFLHLRRIYQWQDVENFVSTVWTMLLKNIILKIHTLSIHPYSPGQDLKMSLVDPRRVGQAWNVEGEAYNVPRLFLTNATLQVKRLCQRTKVQVTVKEISPVMDMAFLLTEHPPSCF